MAYFGALPQVRCGFNFVIKFQWKSTIQMALNGVENLKRVSQFQSYKIKNGTRSSHYTLLQDVTNWSIMADFQSVLRQKYCKIYQNSVKS